VAGSTTEEERLSELLYSVPRDSIDDGAVEETTEVMREDEDQDEQDDSGDPPKP
jgi:hypothetical protein